MSILVDEIKTTTPARQSATGAGLYAGLCRGLAGWGLCAAGCCTIALVSQLRAPRQAQVQWGACSVLPADHSKRLEPQRPRPSDWIRPLPPPGEGDHECLSGRAIS